MADPSRDEATHRCPVSGCEEGNLPKSVLMCRKCWAHVPPSVRKLVMRAYRNGQGEGSPALMAAHKHAIIAVEYALGIRTRTGRH